MNELLWELSNLDLVFLPENKPGRKYISIYTFCPVASKTVYLWPFNAQFTNNSKM